MPRSRSKSPNATRLSRSRSRSPRRHLKEIDIHATRRELKELESKEREINKKYNAKTDVLHKQLAAIEKNREIELRPVKSKIGLLFESLDVYECLNEFELMVRHASNNPKTIFLFDTAAEWNTSPFTCDDNNILSLKPCCDSRPFHDALAKLKDKFNIICKAEVKREYTSRICCSNAYENGNYKVEYAGEEVGWNKLPTKYAKWDRDSTTCHDDNDEVPVSVAKFDDTDFNGDHDGLAGKKIVTVDGCLFLALK